MGAPVAVPGWSPNSDSNFSSQLFCTTGGRGWRSNCLDFFTKWSACPTLITVGIWGNGQWTEDFFLASFLCSQRPVCHVEIRSVRPVCTALGCWLQCRCKCRVAADLLVVRMLVLQVCCLPAMCLEMTQPAFHHSLDSCWRSCIPSLSLPPFFCNAYFHLLKKTKQQKKDTQRKKFFCLWVHSSNDCTSLIWTGLKVGAWNSTCLPM